MTGTKTLADHTMMINKAAKDAGRPAPRVSPRYADQRSATARDAANKVFAIYGQLPSYRAMLDRTRRQSG
jgi:hypothetical protein